MNVTFQTASMDYRARSPVKDRKAQVSKTTSGNFDTVTFNKKAETADETSFARLLARQAAKDVEKGVDEERVSQLKLEVSSGAYHPSAQRIAQYLLGY